MARIRMTPTARVALWALRVYLLILLSLIGLKFVRGFRETRAREVAEARAPAPRGPGSPAR